MSFIRLLVLLALALAWGFLLFEVRDLAASVVAGGLLAFLLGRWGAP